jgi:hypothetical protein
LGRRAMSAELDFEIRRRLGLYLRGDMSLSDFQAWFSPTTWENEDVDVSELIGEIRLRLAELSNAHWTEAEFNKLMEPLAAFVHLGVQGEASQYSSTSVTSRSVWNHGFGSLIRVG